MVVPGARGTQPCWGLLSNCVEGTDVQKDGDGSCSMGVGLPLEMLTPQKTEKALPALEISLRQIS